MRKLQSARKGSLYAEGATVREAKAALQKKIDWACENHAPRIEQRFGYLIVIAASANGYESSVFHPDAIEHGDFYGFSRTMYGQISLNEVLQSARLDAAQRAWTLATCDESHVIGSGLDSWHADDLRRWIRWQRHYDAARNYDGLSVEDARKRADTLA